jgi:hypothetical protein
MMQIQAAQMRGQGGIAGYPMPFGAGGMMQDPQQYAAMMGAAGRGMAGMGQYGNMPGMTGMTGMGAGMGYSGWQMPGMGG